MFSDEFKCQGINSIVNRYENKLLLEAGMQHAPMNEFCCRKNKTLHSTSVTQHASRVYGSMKGSLHNITLPFHYNKQCSIPHRSIKTCSDQSPQETRVHSQGSSQGIGGGKVALVQGFLRILLIPLSAPFFQCSMSISTLITTSGRSLKTFIQNNVASHIGKQCTEIHFHAISVFKC